jgi:porin
MFVIAGILLGSEYQLLGLWKKSVSGSHWPRRISRFWRIATIFGILLLSGASANSATPAPTPAPQEPSLQSSPSKTLTPETLLTGLSSRSNLLGDLFGLRPWLGQFGVTLSISETSEVLGNLTGGVNRGVAYDGLTQVVLQLNTQKAFCWHGGIFNVSALQIHGRNLSADNLFTLQTASGIEGNRSTRLWELWYEQNFPSNDRLGIKIGQQDIGQEFMVSQNSSLYVNSMAGWPMLPSADLPGGGGPAYPLSALGVRVQLRPIDSVTVLAAVFNGSPVSNNNGDPQQENASGTSFPLHGGVLFITELQYTLGGTATAHGPQPLSGTYKFGFWYDSERFADQEIDNRGLSLASSDSTGTPRTYSGDYSFYGIADQMLWRDRSEPKGERTISFFARAMGTPEQNRNLIDFSMNAGFNFHEPILHRVDDTLGVEIGYAKVSSRAADLDRDMAAFHKGYYPIRSGEVFVEATYQYQLTPWCQLQPDFQYVFNPGGGVPNPNSPGNRLKNEAVLGLRVVVNF